MHSWLFNHDLTIKSFICIFVSIIILNETGSLLGRKSGQILFAAHGQGGTGTLLIRRKTTRAKSSTTISSTATRCSNAWTSTARAISSWRTSTVFLTVSETPTVRARSTTFSRPSTSTTVPDWPSLCNFLIQLQEFFIPVNWKTPVLSFGRPLQTGYQYPSN